MAADRQPVRGSEGSSNQASTTARHRRHTLTLVRWAMILICAILIINKPDSAKILAPLLVIATLLGSHLIRKYIFGWRPPVDDSEHEKDGPRRKR